MDNPFALWYSIEFSGENFIVLFNANPEKQQAFSIPEGEWKILVNEEKAGVESLGIISEQIILHTSTGAVLMKI